MSENLQDQFADRLAETFESATQLMDPRDVFDAAVGAATGWALQRADGPAIAETLRHLAAELQSKRRTDPKGAGPCH